MPSGALIVTDVQNDFLPGGPLYVPEGEQILPVVNKLMRAFDLVVATRDWHPANHVSFAEQHEGRKPGDVIEVNGLEQLLWPVHCVRETPGAAFHEELDVDGIDEVFNKGVDVDLDSYSAIFDNGHRKSTGLDRYLQDRKVKDVYICGVATDYCIKFTTLDSCKLGFQTHVVIDACRGVDLKEGDVDRAVEEMRQAGAEIVTSDRLV